VTAPYHAFTDDEHAEHFDLLLAVARNRLEWLALAVLWEARSWGYQGFNSDFYWPYEAAREDISLLREIYEVMKEPDYYLYEHAYAVHLRQFAQAKMKWLTLSEEKALILLLTEDPETVQSRWLALEDPNNDARRRRVLEEIRDAVADEAVQMMRDHDVEGIEGSCLVCGLARRSDLREDG